MSFCSLLFVIWVSIVDVTVVITLILLQKYIHVGKVKFLKLCVQFIEFFPMESVVFLFIDIILPSFRFMVRSYLV